MTLPSTFVDRVKERVNEHIAGLVPDEELDKLVRLQVEHFQREELPKLIKAEISAYLGAAVKAELAKDAYRSIWNSNGTTGASMAVKKLIEENASSILQSMIGSMCQVTVQQMHNNMPRIY